MEKVEQKKVKFKQIQQKVKQNVYKDERKRFAAYLNNKNKIEEQERKLLLKKEQELEKIKQKVI